MSRYSGLEEHYARRLKKAPLVDDLEWCYTNQLRKIADDMSPEKSKISLNTEPKKLTPDDLLQEALKEDPIAEMAKLMTQRYNIEQSIKKLLPKMTKDEITEVYHTLYRIAQKVNEREESK